MSRTTPSWGSTSLEIAQGAIDLSDPKVLQQTPDGTFTVNPQGESLSATLNPNTLTVGFSQPIPTDLRGPITVRLLNPDRTLGEIQQQITNYNISSDGRSIVLRPAANLPAGNNFVFQFPSTCSQGPCAYPGQPVGQSLYVGFTPSKLIGPVVAAASFPVLPVVLGVVLIGVGVAAATGGFGGGGGGTNDSSR